MDAWIDHVDAVINLEEEQEVLVRGNNICDVLVKPYRQTSFGYVGGQNNFSYTIGRPLEYPLLFCL